MLKKISRLLKVIATALILYSLLGFFIVPGIALRIANQQLATHALVPASLERLSFNPFSLTAQLWGLRINSPAPDIAFDYLSVDLELASLWQRQLHLADIHLKGGHVHLKLTAEGVNLSQLFNSPAQAATDEPEARMALRIDRLRIENGQFEFTDSREHTPVNVRYQALNVELNQLNTRAEESAQLTLSAHSQEVGELRWQGALGLNPLRSNGTLSVAGLNLAALWPYAQQTMPLVLEQGLISLSSRYQLSVTDALALNLDEVFVNLQDTRLLDSTQKPLVTLDQLTIKGAAVDLSQQRIHLGEIASHNLKLWAVRQADGLLNWQQLLPPSSEDTHASGEQPWQIEIAQAHLAQSHLYVADQQPTTAVQIALSPLDVQLEGFNSVSSKPFSVTLKSQINDQGRVHAQGQIALNPPTAELRLNTEALDMRLAQAYLEPWVKVELKSGALDSQLHLALTATEPLALSVTGDAQISQLHTVDGVKRRDLLKWRKLEVKALQYQHLHSLRIQELRLDQPYLRLLINENLSTNLSELLVPQTNTTVSEPSEPLPIHIGGIVVNEGSANFADFSLTPHFATAIQGLNGQLSELNNQSSKASKLNLQGRVDTYAPVSIVGELNAFDPLQKLDIATRFKNMELTTLTPYSGKFAGYRIHKGRLSLDLNYQIDNAKLEAHNLLLLENLQLGEKVDSPNAVNLPVRLAVALLKDARGNIEISLPVKGDLANPEFSVMPIVWQSVQNLVLRATQAPFNFVAGLVGSSASNLDHISFTPGSSTLEPAAQEQLSVLAQALAQRPSLRLEIAGQSAMAVDGRFLAEQRLVFLAQKHHYEQLQAQGKKRPDSLTELELSEAQQAQYWPAIYQERLKTPMPEAWLALDKATRHAQLKEAILGNLAGNKTLLRQLSERRAAAIKAYLVDSQLVADERIYLIESAQTQADADGRVVSVLHLGG